MVAAQSAHYPSAGGCQDMKGSEGLLPHQRALLEVYQSGSAPRFVALDAPPGTGKSRALAAIAAQQAAKGGLVVVVVPSALVSQWAYQVRNVGGVLAAIYAAPSDFRLAFDEGADPFPAGGVVICAASVVGAPLAFKALLDSSASLLVVDEVTVSGSSQLGLSLRALADSASQVIFTGARENAWFPTYEMRRWEYPLADGQGGWITPHFSVRVRVYAGDPDEAEVIREAMDLLRRAGYPLIRLLLTRTATQFALLRLAQRLETPERLLLLREDLKESEPERDWSPVVSQRMIEEMWTLLDRFDDLAPDQRLHAVIKEAESARDEERPLMIVADLAQEVDYLVAAIRSPQIRVSAVTASMSAEESEAAAEDLRSGSVLVVTPVFFGAIQRPLPSRTRNIWFTPPRSQHQLQRRLAFGMSGIGTEVVLLKAMPPVTAADELVDRVEIALQNPWQEQRG